MWQIYIVTGSVGFWTDLAAGLPVGSAVIHPGD